MKIYLGDSVYAESQRGDLVLTTENGLDAASNVIVLEPEVLGNLKLFLKKLEDEYEPAHQHECVCADCSKAELTSDND